MCSRTIVIDFFLVYISIGAVRKGAAAKGNQWITD